jgi:phosphoribosylformylglycinamidine cyclo-ligase
MPLSYEDAGVDEDAAARLVERIKPLARRVRIPEVLGELGGFAGLCALPAGMVDPVLVSGTDGVGTKLEIAFATGVHDTVGIDLVAMCVNDVITVGARPLFFLDYFAASRLDVDIAEAVIRGIAEGCSRAGCALLGGETSEIPGMVAPGRYELAGFALGVVERSKILDGRDACVGDVVLGVASSGLHSNGYCLARRIVRSELGDDLSTVVSELGRSVGSELLEPTRIYVRACRALLQALPPRALRAISHITGGGIVGNLPRVLPDGLGARLHTCGWSRPPIFDWLARHGPVQESEMLRTFNLGVGLCAVVAADHAHDAIAALAQAGEKAWTLGDLVAVSPTAPFEQRVTLD